MIHKIYKPVLQKQDDSTGFMTAAFFKFISSELIEETFKYQICNYLI